MKRAQIEALIENRLQFVHPRDLRMRTVREVLDALTMLPETFVLVRADGSDFHPDDIEGIGDEPGARCIVSDLDAAEHVATSLARNSEGRVEYLLLRTVPVDAVTIDRRVRPKQLDTQTSMLDEATALDAPTHQAAAGTGEVAS